MSWKRIGGALKKAGRQAGNVLDNKYVKAALATGLAATGVGAPLAIGLMAAQGAGAKALKGGRLSTIAKGGLRGGAEGAASWAGGKVLGKVGGFLKHAGGGGEASGIAEGGEIVNAVGQPGLTPIHAGAGGVPATIGTAGGTDLSLLASDPSRFRQIAGDVGGFLHGHGRDIADATKLAEGVYGDYRQAKLQDEAMADWRRRQALRDRSQALLLDESRPDLSGLTADPNVRYRRIAAGG